MRQITGETRSLFKASLLLLILLNCSTIIEGTDTSSSNSAETKWEEEVEGFFSENDADVIYDKETGLLLTSSYVNGSGIVGPGAIIGPICDDIIQLEYYCDLYDNCLWDEEKLQCYDNATFIFPTKSPTRQPTLALSPGPEYCSGPDTKQNCIQYMDCVWKSGKCKAGPPTMRPTDEPTNAPTVSPTRAPTNSPTTSPTRNPTTSPTTSPTLNPTSSPTTAEPTQGPTTSPTNRPTKAPTREPTNKPTRSPTDRPTRKPTKSPTGYPTRTPTSRPTLKPTQSPTDRPTKGPTDSPTTGTPSVSPTKSPSGSPTLFPTKSPTNSPTTGTPSVSPTKSPSGSPTFFPTKSPSVSPTKDPTGLPTFSPTKSPSGSPTFFPTKSPSVSPTKDPTGLPTFSPSREPSKSPTKRPTGSPTNFPTRKPSGSPTVRPTRNPSASPTTGIPSLSPSRAPTPPTLTPTTSPSESPTTKSPTFSPTSSPTLPSPVVSLAEAQSRFQFQTNSSYRIVFATGGAVMASDGLQHVVEHLQNDEYFSSRPKVWTQSFLQNAIGVKDVEAFTGEERERVVSLLFEEFCENDSHNMYCNITNALASFENALIPWVDDSNSTDTNSSITEPVNNSTNSTSSPIGDRIRRRLLEQKAILSRGSRGGWIPRILAEKAEDEHAISLVRIVNETQFLKVISQGSRRPDIDAAAEDAEILSTRMTHMSIEVFEHKDLSHDESQSQLGSALDRFSSAFHAKTGVYIQFHHSSMSINPCSSITCSGNGVCVQLSEDEAQCLCNENYFGPLCEKSTDNGGDGDDGTQARSKSGTIIGASGAGLVLMIGAGIFAKKRMNKKNQVDNDEQGGKPSSTDRNVSTKKIFKLFSKKSLSKVGAEPTEQKDGTEGKNNEEKETEPTVVVKARKVDENSPAIIAPNTAHLPHQVSPATPDSPNSPNSPKSPKSPTTPASPASPLPNSQVLPPHTPVSPTSPVPHSATSIGFHTGDHHVPTTNVSPTTPQSPVTEYAMPQPPSLAACPSAPSLASPGAPPSLASPGAPPSLASPYASRGLIASPSAPSLPSPGPPPSLASPQIPALARPMISSPGAAPNMVSPQLPTLASPVGMMNRSTTSMPSPPAGPDAPTPAVPPSLASPVGFGPGHQAGEMPSPTPFVPPLNNALGGEHSPSAVAGENLAPSPIPPPLADIQALGATGAGMKNNAVDSSNQLSPTPIVPPLNDPFAAARQASPFGGRMQQMQRPDPISTVSLTGSGIKPSPGREDVLAHVAENARMYRALAPQVSPVPPRMPQLGEMQMVAKVSSPSAGATPGMGMPNANGPQAPPRPVLPSPYFSPPNSAGIGGGGAGGGAFPANFAPIGMGAHNLQQQQLQWQQQQELLRQQQMAKMQYVPSSPNYVKPTHQVDTNPTSEVDELSMHSPAPLASPNSPQIDSTKQQGSKNGLDVVPQSFEFHRGESGGITSNLDASHVEEVKMRSPDYLGPVKVATDDQIKNDIYPNKEAEESKQAQISAPAKLGKVVVKNKLQQQRHVPVSPFTPESPEEIKLHEPDTPEGFKEHTPVNSPKDDEPPNKETDGNVLPSADEPKKKKKIIVKRIIKKKKKAVQSVSPDFEEEAKKIETIDLNEMDKQQIKGAPIKPGEVVKQTVTEFQNDLKVPIPLVPKSKPQTPREPQTPDILSPMTPKTATTPKSPGMIMSTDNEGLKTVDQQGAVDVASAEAVEEPPKKKKKKKIIVKKIIKKKKKVPSPPKADEGKDQEEGGEGAGDN